MGITFQWFLQKTINFLQTSDTTTTSYQKIVLINFLETKQIPHFCIKRLKKKKH